MIYSNFAWAFQLLLNHHHRLVTCLVDDEDLVKLEKLQQVLSIVN